MPWGWECRQKLIKQFPAKPTVARSPAKPSIEGPGPQKYEIPDLLGGKGYNYIKRAPSYTFGCVTPLMEFKSPITPKAPVLNMAGKNRKGSYRITHCVVSPQIDPPHDKTNVPGPGAYAPRHQATYRQPPAYTMQPAAKPPYQSDDQWTPSPNMYCPAVPSKKPPVFSFGNTPRSQPMPELIPGPGEHEPAYNYVKITKPAFSFGSCYKALKESNIPAPNAYCNKKFMYPKRTIPAPSFGIRHSPYLGETSEFEKPSDLNIAICGEHY